MLILNLDAGRISFSPFPGIKRGFLHSYLYYVKPPSCEMRGLLVKIRSKIRCISRPTYQAGKHSDDSKISQMYWLSLLSHRLFWGALLGAIRNILHKSDILGLKFINA